MNEISNILVIDDDESIRESIKLILEEERYLVDSAKNGIEAIEKSNTKYYNLALIDYRLPDINGTDLLKKMKKGIPKTIKIMVTGYPSMQNAINAVNNGADGFLLKPVNMDNLLLTVKYQLKKQIEDKKYSEKKVAEFLESRVREIHPMAEL